MKKIMESYSTRFIFCFNYSMDIFSFSNSVYVDQISRKVNLESMTTCKRCGHQFEPDYCNKCGKPGKKFIRYTKQYRNLTRQNIIHMPLKKTLICSGIGILYITALTAQIAPPKNKTLNNVVGYQLYQQKQWDYNQLPKNTVQYKTGPKYVMHTESKLINNDLHLLPIATPAINNNFSISPNLGSYLQKSRFLDYEWQKQSWWRDPTKGFGASLLKEIYYGKNNFLPR
jgi:ribosomal protein L37E